MRTPTLDRADAYYFDLPAFPPSGSWVDETGGGLDLAAADSNRWHLTDSAFDVGLQTFALAIRWRSVVPPQSTRFVCDLGLTAGEALFLYLVGAEGDLKVRLGGTDFDAGSGLQGDGEWHTSVLVIDRTSSEAVIYLDGAEVSRNDITGVPALGDGYLSLRNASTGSPATQLEGEVDGFALWLGEALSPEDVALVGPELQAGKDGRLAPNVRGNILDEAEGAWMGSRAHADKWPDIRGRHHAFPRANAQHVADPVDPHWLLDGTDPLRALDLIKAPALNAVDYDSEGMTWVLVAEVDDPVAAGATQQWISCRNDAGDGGYLFQIRNTGGTRAFIYHSGNTASRASLGPAGDFAGEVEVFAHSRGVTGGGRTNLMYTNGATQVSTNDPTGVMDTDQGYTFGLEPRDNSNIASGKLIGLAYFRRDLTADEITEAALALREGAQSSAYDVGHVRQAVPNQVVHSTAPLNWVGGTGRHVFIMRLTSLEGWVPGREAGPFGAGGGGNDYRPFWCRITSVGRWTLRVRNAGDSGWSFLRTTPSGANPPFVQGRVYSVMWDLSDQATNVVRFCYSEDDLTDPDDPAWIEHWTTTWNALGDTMSTATQLVIGANVPTGSVGLACKLYRHKVIYNGVTMSDEAWRDGIMEDWTAARGAEYVPPPEAPAEPGKVAAHLTFDGQPDSFIHAPLPLTGGPGKAWTILRVDSLKWWRLLESYLTGETNDPASSTYDQRAHSLGRRTRDGVGLEVRLEARDAGEALVTDWFGPVPGSLHRGRLSVMLDYDPATGLQRLMVSSLDLRDPEDPGWVPVVEQVDLASAGSPDRPTSFSVIGSRGGLNPLPEAFQLHYHQTGYAGQVVSSRDWETLTRDEADARAALDDQGNLYTFEAGVVVFLLPEPEVTYIVPPTRVHAELVRRTPTENGPHAFTLVDRLVGAYGLAWAEVLNGEGTGQATILPTEQGQDVKDLLRGMEEPAELVIYQDDRLQFQGPIVGLSAQRAGQGIALQIHARSRFNYVRRWWLPPDETFSYDQVDQVLIAKALLDSHQARSWGHFGIDTSAMVASGVLRDRTYIGAEAHNIAERVQELAAVDEGFDFYVDPTGLVVVGHPELGQDRRDEVVLDARNISNPNAVWSVGPEDVIGVAFAASAQDDGSFVEAIQEEPDTMEKWGRTTLFQTFQGISVQSTLRKYAVRATTKRARALFQPQPDIMPLEEVDGTFGLGDTIEVAYDYGLGLDVARRRVTRLGKKVDDVGRIMGELSLE